jgi:uncharacterized protein
LGKRLVKLRTGMVLSNRGGVLPAFKRPLKFGLATILGSGKQVMSWIHIRDLVNMYIHAIENNEMHGAFNAVAPYPTANRRLVLTLAREIKGRFFISLYVPSFLLKWILGEMSIEVLKSTTANAAKIRGTGFHFLYPGIESTIGSLINHPDH